MIIKRLIQQKIEELLFRGKVLVLYGPRQAGKTTLIKELQKKYPDNSIYLTCDEPDIRLAFTNTTSSAMKNFIGDKCLIFLDEAQRVENIGLSLKLLFDTFPEIQIVATGSSSFELANKINEPLTGRKREFFLPPISVQELIETNGSIETNRTIEQRLIFGLYPETIYCGAEKAKNILIELTGSYLYKDILSHQSLKHPDLLEKILRALALQIGQEISYIELANTVGTTRQTVEKYIELLEKTFVIFRLPPLCRNHRKELGKMRKIYFFDNGVRNAMINAFQDISLRNDVGMLWENFLISERQKLNAANLEFVNRYFWRDYQQHEIDYLEEKDGTLTGFEFKWKEKQYSPPKTFKNLYPDTPVKLVTRENFLDFCTK